MKTTVWNHLSLLLILVWALGACQSENDAKDAKNVAEKASISQYETQPFDLEEVKKTYKNAELSILDVSERERNGKNSIAVTLSVPLNPAENFQSYFNVNIPNQGIVDGAWVLSENGKIAWFENILPKTTYEVSIFHGLTAATGAKLQQSIAEKVTTRNLIPSVNFNSQGAFLTTNLSGGLPIVSVNIQSVNIDFYRIAPDKINTFFERTRGNQRRYWNVKYLTNLGELTYSGRFDLSAPENTRTERSIAVNNISELQQPGIYLAVMLPAGDYYDKDLIWFSVTDIGLHARIYQNQLDVYSSSLNSGKPLTDIKVSLLDHNSKVIKQARSNDQGLTSFIAIENAKLILAESDEHVSLIQLQQPGLDLSEFDLGERPQRPLELFIYTPRDLFRPGERIDFNGLLRDGDGELVETPALNASIKSPDGRIVNSFVWTPQQAGYYAHHWLIPDNAAVGNWELHVQGPFSAPIIFPFKVEEFLPERMKLTFNPNAQESASYDASSALDIPVLGEYLYGAPASGNRLSTLVNINLWRSPIESLKDYEFGDIRETQFNRNFDLSDLNLNDAGEGTLHIESQWQQVRSPLRIKTICSLYESGGRPVSRAHSSLVWPRETLIGIRPYFKKDRDGSYNPEANSRIAFDIVNATVQGDLKAASNLDVRLIREDRRYFWVFQNGDWGWEWTDKEFTEFNQTLSIEEGEKAKLELTVDWGSYRLEIRNPDQDTVSSLRFYAGYNWYADWKRAQSGNDAARPDKITLALDKGAYGANDIAHLKIVPPEPSEVLILVEGDKPLWNQRLSIPAEGSTIDIPIDAKWNQHNLYISAIGLQAADNKKQLTPKRSLGLIHLPLDREARKLTVDFTVPEKALPNKKLNANIHVGNAMVNVSDQSPIYLTLAAVDVGVLSISDFTTPDPFTGFFGQRRFGVEVKDMYNHVIEFNDFPHAKLRFGGDVDISRGGKEPQSQVQIVSLFSGLVALDEQGDANIPLDIPDFNGRLRLMALAFSNNQFGSGEQEVTIAAPVVTQISMPRFLATGDQSSLALDIQNTTTESQSLTLELISEGPVELTDSKIQSLVLAPKEKTTLRQLITAVGHQGAADISLQVTGDKIEAFTRHWQLGVRPAYPAILKQQRVVIPGNQIHQFDTEILDTILPNTLETRLTIAATPNLDIASQVKHLMKYPYGCLEQTSSKAYPLTFATPENRIRFQIDHLSDNERLKRIQAGLDHIATMQLASGGFGLWSSRSPEEHWLTVYATDFFLNAQEQGIDVSPTLLNNALNRLKQYVNHSGRMIGERWSEDDQHYNFAYKAYAAYVLARQNQAPLGSLRQLYDHKLNHARSGLAQIQLGIALERMGDKTRAKHAIETGLKNLPSQRAYWGDYGSEIRDLGMMIYLLISNHLYENEAKALAFNLSDALKNRHWFSTQERTALFLAGIALEQNASSPWQAQVTLGDDSLSVKRDKTYQDLIDEIQSRAGISVASTTDTQLYASIEFNGYGSEPPSPAENGVSIQRAWYNKQGQLVTPTTMKVGELYLVHLSLRANQRTPDALVIDLLPAGLELENQNLEYAIKLDDFKIEGTNLNTLKNRTQIKYQEYRDDRFVAAVELNNWQSTDLFYLVRAVTPGTYHVPAPLVEDMYRPEIRGVGTTWDLLNVQ